MSKLIMGGRAMGLLAILGLGIVSCSKELSSGSATTATSATTSTSVTTSSVITVAVDSSSGTVDSVYILQPCAAGYFRDTVAASALLPGITAYLDTAYAGYHFLKGYVIKDSAGTVGGYVVIISYNGKPVALLFSSAGVFTGVLEQREAGDLHGNGWHEGGRYGNRDGRHKDTVALSTLPAAITSWYNSNYPLDTLLKAFKNYDSSYLVITRDDGIVYATVFTSGGTFVKREIIAVPGGTVASLDQSALPAGILSYLTTTYPGYVFEKAFSLSGASAVQDYLVVIDANNTKYALVFDGSGNLLSVRIIW